MTASDLFLIMLAANGGSIKGKTLAQKRAFFLNQMLGLGLHYRPHFYGPYSPELDEAIERCKALGFVAENNVDFNVKKDGFEIRRYDYTLTEGGQELVEYLRRKQPDEVERVTEVVQKVAAQDNGNYMKASIAAKALHILQRESRPMTEKEIIGEARQLGWEMTEEATLAAASLLVNLGLVEKG